MNVTQLHPEKNSLSKAANPGVDPHDRATITVTEAAHVLGISRSTAYELVHAGTLPALRLGRRIVVPTHALEELLDSARPAS